MRLPDEMRRLTDHLNEAYEGRVEAVAAIRSEAVEDLAKLHTAHQEMATALRGQLQDAERSRQDAERSRRREATEATRHRAGYVDSLRASVASARASIASKMKELKSEMGEARRVWVEFGGRMRQARGRVAVTPPAWAPEREAAVTPPKGRRRKGWLRT